VSNDLNRCEFIGRLGKDPELRYSPGGDAFCNFSIACGWKTKDKDGAEWVRATAFGKLAEICGQYLKKGSQVYIAGRLTTRKWKNKEGVDQYSTEINVDQMQMLGGKSESDAPPVAKNSQRVASNVEEIDDDIPFN
jgi:single-strand DNA-binding protein